MGACITVAVLAAAADAPGDADAAALALAGADAGAGGGATAVGEGRWSLHAASASGKRTASVRRRKTMDRLRGYLLTRWWAVEPVL